MPERTIMKASNPLLLSLALLVGLAFFRANLAVSQDKSASTHRGASTDPNPNTNQDQELGNEKKDKAEEKRKTASSRGNLAGTITGCQPYYRLRHYSSRWLHFPSAGKRQNFSAIGDWNCRFGYEQRK